MYPGLADVESQAPKCVQVFWVTLDVDCIPDPNSKKCVRIECVHFEFGSGTQTTSNVKSSKKLTLRKVPRNWRFWTIFDILKSLKKASLTLKSVYIAGSELHLT